MTAAGVISADLNYKDTNKRAQKQVHLHFAEREYLRRSQRYEKSRTGAKPNRIPFGKTFHKMQKSRYGTKKERHGGGPEPILSVPGTKRQKVVYFVENTGIFSYFCS